MRPGMSVCAADRLYAHVHIPSTLCLCAYESCQKHRETQSVFHPVQNTENTYLPCRPLTLNISHSHVGWKCVCLLTCVKKVIRSVSKDKTVWSTDFYSATVYFSLSSDRTFTRRTVCLLHLGHASRLCLFACVHRVHAPTCLRLCSGGGWDRGACAVLRFNTHTHT